MNIKNFIFILLFVTIYSFTKIEIYKLNHFPEPFVPEQNQLTEDRIILGKKLFFDPILSRDSTISCSTCHNPRFAFTDRKEKAVGIKGNIVNRNTPTLTNVAYNNSFMLDGVNPSLENQAIVPFHEKNEFDLHILIAADRLLNDSDYVDLSIRAYNENPSPFVITSALASFQRTLISGNSKYDKHITRNVELTESEAKGKDLFFNKLHCTKCHSGFNFTNYSLTNNGLYEVYPDSGRIRLTGNPKDKGVFKVPTLRNIEITHPYMHDGSIKSLENVIYHYMSGGKNHTNKHEVLKPFILNNDEVKSLISFLNTLTDTSFINQYSSK
jgi:cytochrome c peroxidase